MKKSRLAAFGIIVATIIAVIIAFASDIRNSMTLGLDLQGGFEILYQVTPLEGQEMPDMEAVVSSVRESLRQALTPEVLENRLNARFHQAMNDLFEQEDLRAILKYREVYAHFNHASDKGDHAADILLDILVKS